MSPDINHTHRDIKGGWLRPAVFGVMDGLVSNSALIAGVVGASASVSTVTLSGMAGLAAGAFSMAAGEYVSVKSDTEAIEAEVEAERHELRVNAAEEEKELAQMYEKRGVSPDLARAVAAELSKDFEHALDIHVREELGVDKDDLPSAVVAGASSFVAFAIGAMVPLLPYLLGAQNFLASALFTGAALFATGAAVSRVTPRTWWYSGMRQLLFGATAAAVTFLVGSLVGTQLG
jgi:VIT1/CCC1 family predicted Fe2+/Mn2+ transporter